MADLPVREKIGRAKSLPDEDYAAAYASIDTEADAALAALCRKEEEVG